MNELIKEYYTSTFPTDELGEELKDGLTFQDLFVALDTYKDIYTLFGIDDSIIRERLFIKLSALMNVDYSYTYEQWLLGN